MGTKDLANKGDRVGDGTFKRLIRGRQPGLQAWMFSGGSCEQLLKCRSSLLRQLILSPTNPLNLAVTHPMMFPVGHKRAQMRTDGSCCIFRHLLSHFRRRELLSASGPLEMAVSLEDEFPSCLTGQGRIRPGHTPAYFADLPRS